MTNLFVPLFVAVAFSLAGVEGKFMKVPVKCIIKVNDKYPENLRCTSVCNQIENSTWVEGVVYERTVGLMILGKMAKVTFNKNEMVSCEVVASKTDAELEKSYQETFEKPTTVKPTPASTTKAPKVPTEAPKAKDLARNHHTKEPFHSPMEITTDEPKIISCHFGSTGIIPGVTLISTGRSDKPQESSTDKPHEGNESGANPGPQGNYRKQVCPSPWKQLDNACFYMSAEDEAGCRDDGREYCVKIGGKLASIRSAKENIFVKKTFEFETTWIGLTDEGEQGDLKWEDSSNSTYRKGVESEQMRETLRVKGHWDSRNWDDYEPNNVCVEMLKSGRWKFEGCDEIGRRYLCRRNAEWHPRTGCPPGWAKHLTTDKCYFVSTYKTTFEDAAGKCKFLSFNSTMLVPTSQKENEIIGDLTKENLWVGLHDKDGEGHFVDEKGVPATYFNWDSGEPNDIDTGDCVERKVSGMWSNVHCDNKIKFACAI